jgi:hypothetical protein
MTGHVFHPGHDELHGVTVVLDTLGGKTHVGRFHERNDQGVLLHDVGSYDPASGGNTREDFLRRTLKFGIRIDHRHFVVPNAEVAAIIPLGSLTL